MQSGPILPSSGSLHRSRRHGVEESVARYLSQLDTADRQTAAGEAALGGSSVARTARLKGEADQARRRRVKRLKAIERSDAGRAPIEQRLFHPILISRSMATSGRGSGMVGYNGASGRSIRRTHLIVAHEVTNVGTDKSHLANMANQAKVALEAENLEAFADRGYFKGEEILACDEAGITVTLPKPQTSEAKSEGRSRQAGFSLRWLEGHLTFVLPVRSSPTTSRTRKMDWSCTTTRRPTRAGTCALKGSVHEGTATSHQAVGGRVCC